MADETERATTGTEQHSGGTEQRTQPTGEDTLATKSLNICYRISGACRALYEQYGAYLILGVACLFFTALGSSIGFRASQALFQEVYKVQQANFDAQTATYDERILNARRMIAESNARSDSLAKRLAELGIRSADVAEGATKAAASASDTAKSLGDTLKNQKGESK